MSTFVEIDRVQIGRLYNLNTYAPSVIGTNFRKIKLVAILDYKKAIKEANIDLLARRVFPYLPAENQTPSDHTQHTYYLFQDILSDLRPIVLARPWIVTSTDNEVEQVTSLRATININNTSDSKLLAIKRQLILLDADFELTLKDD